MKKMLLTAILGSAAFSALTRLLQDLRDTAPAK